MNLLKAYFLDSLAKQANRCALEVNGQAYAYETFNALVSRISNVIEAEGIGNKAIVVLNEHTVDSHAGILAVNFTGNTILPVEPSWPRQRILDVLKAVNPAAVLYNSNSTEKELLAFIKESSDCSFIDTESRAFTERSLNNNAHSNYTGIAYIIFTSGSTGVPKGVPVKQTSLEAFLKYYKQTYDFNEADRFLQVYDITFDVAYFSFLVPLCVGACCCILSSRKGVPKYLSVLDDLAKRKISVVSMVPSVLAFVKKYLDKQEAPSLRYSFFSGDALYHSDALAWKKFASASAIHNFYGPTETTIVCTRYIWDENTAAEELNHDIVPLGKAFPGMQFQIIDDENKQVPEGEVGELAFAGVQVIDQYLNNVHTDKFFRVRGKKEELYYKTGDLASLNKKGNLVFHGRKDHQVKINGYRIELEEVQLAVQKLVVEKCVVVKKRNDQHIDYLKVFIEGKARAVEDLKLALNKYLPDYMIPSEFEFINQIPLSENGKINKLYLQSL